MLSIKGLSFSYEDGERIFDDLSLSMDEGERILILSPPGSGKTTLSKILSGALGEDDGELSGYSFSIDGDDVLSLCDSRRSAFVARVSQDSSELFVFPTLWDEVAFPMAARKVPYDEIRMKADEIIGYYDLGKLSESSVMELSGGEMRRLSLASADALSSKLYIYDESFDELSKRYRERVKEIIGEKKYAIVLASRFLECFEGFFDKMYTISRGRLSLLSSVPKYSLSFQHAEIEEEHELRVENLSFSLSHESSSFHSALELRVPSFSLKSGGIKLLTGENGSGKSTFSKLLVGLYQESTGTFSLDGVRIGSKDRKRRISYLMQDPFPSLYLPRVRDELESVSSDNERIEEAMAVFSLKGDEYVSTLSFGKAKMLQSAIYYLLRRPFVILDEPDVALSYADVEKVVDAFLSTGAGILLITHDENIKKMGYEGYTISDGVLS